MYETISVTSSEISSMLRIVIRMVMHTMQQLLHQFIACYKNKFFGPLPIPISRHLPFIRTWVAMHSEDLLTCYNQCSYLQFWGESRGGSRGPRTPPPPGPQRGVLDPSSKMKKTAFIIFSFIKFHLINRYKSISISSKIYLKNSD